jgi:hypothetical protein
VKYNENIKEIIPKTNKKLKKKTHKRRWRKLNNKNNG